MRTLVLIISLTLASTAWAEKKNPEDEAQAARKFSEQLKGEVEYLRTIFEESDTALPSVVKRYIEMTEQEAELVARSAEALEGNQSRRAQMLRERAQAFCSRRGNLSEQVHTLAKKTKAEMADKNTDKPADMPPEKPFAKPEANDIVQKPPKDSSHKDGNVKVSGPESVKEYPSQKKDPQYETAPPAKDLSSAEKRLREIEEQEAKLNQEKRKLLDAVRQTAEE
jgi:hypothetical protein